MFHASRGVWLSMYVVCLGLMLLLSGCNRNPADKPSNRDIPAVIDWLKDRLREDISKFQPVQEYLAQHRVYISLTTSPKRITYLPQLFEMLDVTKVTAIIVSLPERFGRDQSEYVIPDELARYPKVVINRIAKDLGPISKLIPAVKYALERDPSGEDFIITIDDDIGYPYGMVNEMIKHLVYSQKTVVGGSTEPLSKFELQGHSWPPAAESAIIEGYGAIGYRAREVDTEKMLAIIDGMISSQGDRSCYLSDDLVISYVFNRAGYRLQRIDTDYHGRSNLIPLAYGFEEDALHKGAGDASKPSNNEKYQRCLAYINKNFR